MASLPYCNYALYDSDGVIRWVGVTGNLEKRLLLIRYAIGRKTGTYAVLATFCKADDLRVEVLFVGSRGLALLNEQALIERYGRLWDQTGTLCNLSGGGPGGHSGYPQSPKRQRHALNSVERWIAMHLAFSAPGGNALTRRYTRRPRLHTKTF